MDYRSMYPESVGLFSMGVVDQELIIEVRHVEN